MAILFAVPKPITTRPSGPFGINWASRQALALRNWVPLTDWSRGREMVFKSAGTEVSANWKGTPRFGLSPTFGGAGSGYITTVHPDLYDGVTLPRDVTISAWFIPRTSGIGTTFGRIFEQDAGSNLQFALLMAGADTDIQFNIDIDACVATSVLTLNQPALAHCVLGGGGSAMSLYINGKLGGTQTNALGYFPTDASLVYLGNRATPDRSFDGPVWDYRVRYRTLTPGDVFDEWVNSGELYWVPSNTRLFSVGAAAVTARTSTYVIG